MNIWTFQKKPHLLIEYESLGRQVFDQETVKHNWIKQTKEIQKFIVNTNT